MWQAVVKCRLCLRLNCLFGRIDGKAVFPYLGRMKTTIDLPEDVLHRAKVVAAQRRTTLKELFLSGSNWS
jgi:hypothetical protein